MAERGDNYFREREAELRALGFDPDEDDDWARPDYDDHTPELT